MQAITKVLNERLMGASGKQVIALRFAGDISSASKEAVVGTYHSLDATENRQILLDFAAVEYLNSSGIALVIQVLMEASRASQVVGICGLTKHFTKVFTMVGIPRYAGLFEDEASALATM